MKGAFGNEGALRFYGAPANPADASRECSWSSATAEQSHFDAEDEQQNNYPARQTENQRAK
jgi:hypothetical protein